MAVWNIKTKPTSPTRFSAFDGTLFFQANLVKHLKRNQTTCYGAVVLSFWCSTRTFGDTSGYYIITITSIVAITKKIFKTSFIVIEYIHRILFLYWGYVLNNFIKYRRNFSNYYDVIYTNSYPVSAEGLVNTRNSTTWSLNVSFIRVSGVQIDLPGIKCSI